MRCVLVSVLLIPAAVCAQTQKPRPPAQVAVPFIGCKADGQTDPIEAPAGTSKMVSIDPQVAGRLAYYKAALGPGVLGPRGWNCFESYSGNGSSLFIAPGPFSGQELFTPGWRGFTGPAIQVAVSIGFTSGRMQVARIAARVFPAHQDIVDSVITEGMPQARNLPAGPFPADKLTYITQEIVEYTTPPQTDGLGTQSRLLKAADAIEGVAMLTGEEPSLVQLSARLPEELHDLMPIIVRQFEEVSATKPK